MAEAAAAAASSAIMTDNKEQDLSDRLHSQFTPVNQRYHGEYASHMNNSYLPDAPAAEQRQKDIGPFSNLQETRGEQESVSRVSFSVI